MCSDKSEKNWKQVREDLVGSKELPDDEMEEVEDDMDNLESEKKSLSNLSYEELEDKLTETEQKVHENWEKSVRAMAELDNVRRRSEKDVESAHRYGLEKFVDTLLPVVDSLEQALQLAEKEGNKPMHEGLELTMKLFLDGLSKHGVTQINPIGETFDPQLHEAMSMMQADNAPENSVINVFQRGYKLNDRVVRPARVIVAKG